MVARVVLGGVLKGIVMLMGVRMVGSSAPVVSTINLVFANIVRVLEGTNYIDL